MRKSISKRIRVTKRGKFIRRKMAQDHFRAKKSGKQIRKKRGGLSLTLKDAKIFQGHR